MPLVDKLDLEGVREEIFFTDTKRARKGVVYHKNKQYELLFGEHDNCIGSFPVKTGDITLIYGKDYSLRPDIPLKLYSEADGQDYAERKDFLNKMSKNRLCPEFQK